MKCAVIALLALPCALAQDAKGCRAKEENLACIKANAEGWLQFCPDDASLADGEGEDSKCFRLQAKSYSALDGSTVVDTVASLSMDVSAAASVQALSTSDCSSGGVCASASAGGQLSVKTLPIKTSSSLLGLGDEIFLDAMIFTQDGNVTYDGKSETVEKGSYKWNLRIKRSALQSSSTNSAKVEFTVKAAAGASEVGSGSTNADGSTQAGAMKSLGRFWASTATGGEWRTCTIAVVEASGESTISYEFPGPFLEATYDPYVARVSADGGDSSGASALAASVAPAAAVLAALSL